jgi:hypothetical protein
MRTTDCHEWQLRGRANIPLAPHDVNPNPQAAGAVILIISVILIDLRWYVLDLANLRKAVLFDGDVVPPVCCHQRLAVLEKPRLKKILGSSLCNQHTANGPLANPGCNRLTKQEPFSLLRIKLDSYRLRSTDS